MANVLNDLAADLYKAAEIVGRSAVGFIPSVTVNGGSEVAAQNTTVRSHKTDEGTINETATPAMTIPEGDDVTVTTDTMTLNKVVNAQIPFTGEEMGFIDQGAGFQTVYGDIISRKMNGMMKLIEKNVAIEAYKNSSRTVGTAGTTPFGSNFNEIAEARQVLLDNGMPVDDGMTSLVLSTTAGTKLRNLAQLQKANEAGNDTLLRQGTLLDLQGVMLKESSQVQAHTKGTGASKLVNGDLAVGDTTITTDGGSGTIVAGDVVTFAGDTVNSYVVTEALASGSFEIGAPGLRVAIADNAAITVGNSYTANVALHRSAIELAIRPMLSPLASAAADAMVVQDPHSGLSWQVEVYGGYKKAMIDITAVYGVKAWNKEAIATVLG